MSLETFGEILQDLMVLQVKLEMISEGCECAIIEGLLTDLNLILLQEPVTDTIEKGILFHREFADDIQEYFLNRKIR